MTGGSRNLGLFPLGLVILPGEHVPLHIFEPRYRALVADCTLEQQPFVITMATDDGVARSGCTATIEALVRRFDDGRMNIVVVGGERVEIVEQTAGRLYVTARVEEILDDEPDADPELAAAVRSQFGRLAEVVAGAPVEPAADVPLSYAVAGAMEVDVLVKQRLLELRSENARLELVQTVLETALAGLDRREVAAERAKTNGKVSLQ